MTDPTADRWPEHRADWEIETDMSPKAFDRAAAETRLAADTIAAARRVLVDGTDAETVGREAGRSGQWARAAAKRVRKAAGQAFQPGGWR
mgnify:CR=1 FL=1